jgi:hypothetical protein
LQQVEQQWTRPTGTRRVTQNVLVYLADWLPPLALLASLVVLLWRYFNPFQNPGISPPHLADMLLPVFVVLAVLIILHLLIAVLLPLRWPAIRGEFQKRLEVRLRQELEGVYAPIPGDVADAVAQDRRQVEKLAAETREVAAWLEKREQSGAIAGLYGH